MQRVLAAAIEYERRVNEELDRPDEERDYDRLFDAYAQLDQLSQVEDEVEAFLTESRDRVDELRDRWLRLEGLAAEADIPEREPRSG